MTSLMEAATHKTCYNPEWAKEFPISSAHDNKYIFYCIPCRKKCHRCMKRGDVKLHCETSAHKKMKDILLNHQDLSFPLVVVQTPSE